jgi:hypothetical protein
VDQVARTEAGEDVADLVALMKAIPPDLVDSSACCLLNPVFASSPAVGGADADVVLGETLIDIKVTKTDRVSREWFDQVLSYYLLFRLGGLHDVTDQPSLTYLGLYFARHGRLVKWPITALGSAETLDAAAKQLRQYGLAAGGETDLR